LILLLTFLIICDLQGFVEARRRKKHGRWKKARSRAKTKSKKQNSKFENVLKNFDRSDKCECGPVVSDRRRMDTRIVNGEEADPHEFPWIASLMGKDGWWYCGSTIINEEWILTAAHCVEDEEASKVFVRVGDHDNADDSDTKFDKKQTLEVKKIIIHAGYDTDSGNNDVALLKLKKKIDFKSFKGTVAPVCIPEEMKTYNGEIVTVAGWGHQEENANYQTEKLRKTDVKVISATSCRTDFKYKKDWITSRMLCTFSPDSKDVTDACQGDSGGPLVFHNKDRDKYELIGVVSWGIGCARKEYPGVFAKLSKLWPWVLKKMKKGNLCIG